MSLPDRRVAVAVFDGKCNLCSTFASLLQHLVSPHCLDVVPCGSSLQKKLAPEITEAVCQRAFVLRDEEGTTHTGGEAAARAVAMAPLLAPCRPLIASRAGLSFARVVYLVMNFIRK